MLKAQIMKLPNPTLKPPFSIIGAARRTFVFVSVHNIFMLHKKQEEKNHRKKREKRGNL